MTPDAQIPPDQRAFDHAPTRQAWRRARLRVAGGLVVLIMVTLVAFGLVGTYETQIRLAGAGLLPALFFGIVLPAGLYAYIGSLRRLGRMRKVLQSNPWKFRAAARKHPHAREAKGVAVQLKAKEGEEWGQVMAARNPLRWYRWDPAMEQGIWLAGVATTGAVIALPGGRGLMTLERDYWGSASGRRRSEHDRSRDRLSKEPGRGRA
ncbi:hypothetical protein J7E96_20735 [Streptomyces sp. ISL-96]|uniref:hypothetical protein n=1 Tax=unclassified Streptomyces TaxID=2593676 RepID=UPI001BE9990D|nr:MULTISPECIES: hypothetical protein [unclassified Streptomyces]MBT2397841.1 hypothetical protein [Streptomyces sp. ISL-100]MBT2490897.1 hypothetical protein [Streptomyces sp. ISL-96]